MNANLKQNQIKPCTHLKIVHRRNDKDELDYIESELRQCDKLQERIKEDSFTLHVSCLKTINEYTKKCLKNSTSSQAKDIIEILDNNLNLIIKIGDKLGFSSIFNEACTKLS